ncbi:class I SAM-dependent methyltransferase [Sphaerisporangium sp. B11E5]|uniref:class I SAM-dependent methyltransferase n=1 Tax=Sphaerisporangium sp. B11E5 TaxID=3153563 RepID=UPI00325F4571
MTHTHDHQGHHHGHGHGHGTDAGTDEALAEILDLDAEVLRPLQTEMIDHVHTLAAGTPIRRVLDVGSGTGTGTLALLQRFPDAEAIALDSSVEMLRRLEAKAHDLGLAGRVRTVAADLDTTWPSVGTVDLAWASASLHHMADPARVLAAMFTALRPGGLLAVVELDSFPRFLPHDLGIGRPGLEERCQAAVTAANTAAMPMFGADWTPLLRQAGFTVELSRHLTADIPAPIPAAARRYAETILRRTRARLTDHLSPEDLTTLDTLLDNTTPAGIVHRDDLTVHATRFLWVARRP